MRNQTWDKGELVKDDELYLDDDVLKVRDHISGEVREPTEAETEQFYWKPPRNPLAEIDKINTTIADYGTLKAKVEALERK